MLIHIVIFLIGFKHVYSALGENADSESNHSFIHNWNFLDLYTILPILGMGTYRFQVITLLERSL